MQLIMNDWFKGARNKLCMHSDKYTFQKNGKTFSGTRCKPYVDPATDDQKDVRQRFKKAVVARGLVLKSTELKTSWHERYADALRKNQTQAYSLNGYLVQEYFAGHMNDDGSIKSLS